MRRQGSITAVLLALLFGAIVAVNAAAAEKPFKATLDNGLTVIIDEEHTAPVTAIEMWVKVGSADESEAEAGLSHVFEHMLFKGTGKRKVGEIANVIESVGGDINAYTSYDNTVYHLVVPSRSFSTALDIMSDAVQHSSFDPAELKKELEVVLEELRMNEDSPGRSLYKKVLADAYTTHPYRRPVIGYEKVILGLNRDEILRFFRKWYIPNNMTLVIAGDVNRDEALAEVTKAFAGFKKGPDPHKDRPVEPPQPSMKTAVVTKKIKQAYLGMGFHIPELKSADTYAIDVLAGVLGGGAGSRLYRRLKVEEAIVNDVSVYPMSLKDPGILFVTAALDAKNTGRAAAEIVHEIRRLAYGGVNPDEIDKVKLNLESEFVYSRETMQGLATKYGYYETISGNLDYERQYLDGIRKVTPQDVARAAAKYLTDSNMTAAVFLPQDSKETLSAQTLSAVIKDSSGKSAKAFATVPAAQDAISKVKLDNGVTLLIKEKHSNPTVAVYAAFPGGLRYENPADDGIGAFTAAMLTRGTGKLSRQEISSVVESMAGSVAGFSGWNSTGVSGEFLSQYFDRGFAVFADVLMNPSFPQDEMAKLKIETKEAIKNSEDNLPSYTFKLLYKKLFTAHPYGMPSLGTPETVDSFKIEDLIAHHNKFFVPQRLVITIVGDVNKDYATETVKRYFKDFNRKAAPLTQPPVETRQTAVRSTGDVKETAQTNIGIGFLGAPLGSPESYALRVLTEVLSGQGGRLFLELRDKQSLAYSVSAFSKEGVDPGIFGIYLGCAPPKKDAAIEGILSELRKVTGQKVTEEELARAKNSLIGGYQIGLQEAASQASDITNNELYGLGYDFSNLYPAKIEAVSADDVLRVAKKVIDLNAYTISVVGPNGNTKK